MHSFIHMHKNKLKNLSDSHTRFKTLQSRNYERILKILPKPHNLLIVCLK